MTSSYSSHNDKDQQNNQQQFQKGYGGREPSFTVNRISDWCHGSQCAEFSES